MKIHKLTSSQKTLCTGVFALAAGLSVLFAAQSTNLPPPAVTTTTQTRAELPPSPANMHKPETYVLDTHVIAQSETANRIPLDPVVDNPSSTPAQASWQMGGVKAETPSIPLSEKISDYAIVELQQESTHYPKVGEQVLLPMLHGKNLVAIVESVQVLANGDYSWSGHLQGSGSDYPVVMTYGERSVFATITTPDGSYTMESVNGLGWLYKNPAEVELSSPGAKDFLEIEEQH